MKNNILIITILWVFQGCSSDINQPNRTDPGTSIDINPSVTFQTISGFGGANQMWGSTFPSDMDIKNAYGTEDTDLGFSIFRVRIASNPTEWPAIIDVAKEAQSYGAIILASPWSPPANLKSNNSEVGGHLLEENYEAFAEHLNDFVAFMSSNGVEIYSISIQNEPDIQVSYESCDWTSSAMRDFLKNYGQLITGAKVAAPESFNFSRGYTDVILNDEEAVNNIDIVAGHIYGGGQGAYPLAENKEKEIWMTEYLMNLNTGNDGADPWESYSEDQIWTETMVMLETVHEAMSNNWNAYIWWYLKRYYSFLGDGTQGTTDGEVLKRGYAFSHFSKFIRPGYQRIDIDEESSTGLQITAYDGGGKVTAVIINEGNVPVKINLSIDGFGISKATSYVTSLSTNRQQQELEITENKASTSISARSITTIVLE